MNKRELAVIVEEVTKANRIAVVSHVDPDGDAIGSLLAFGKGMVNMGKAVDVLVQKPLERPFTYLDYAHIVSLNLKEGEYLVVTLDCASPDRLGGFRERLLANPMVINIDHHQTNTNFGTINWVEPHASSTGEMVFYILKALGVYFDKGICQNIYYAIHSDTGGFRYNNTTQESLGVASELVAMGANPWDLSQKVMDRVSLARLKLIGRAVDTAKFFGDGRGCLVRMDPEYMEEIGAQLSDWDGIVEMFRALEGVELAVAVREEKGGHKFSLRSKGEIDVSGIAREFGGGGHRNAAGFTLYGDYEDALGLFFQALKRHYNWL